MKSYQDNTDLLIGFTDLMTNVNQRLFQNIDNVLVVQGLVDAFSFPAGLHLVGHTQQLQLVADG